MRLLLLFSLFSIPIFHATGQSIVDSCFTSLPAQSIDFFGNDLSSTGNFETDLLEWNGFSWDGALANADITIEPPGDNPGCRAVFMGNGQTWTTGGEGFGFRLSAPLQLGMTYTITCQYVSHGNGSDGNFSPGVYTNTVPSLSGAVFIGNLPSVGYNWTLDSISFFVDMSHAGNDWILIHSGPNGSSGLVSSFCSECGYSSGTTGFCCGEDGDMVSELEMPNIFTPNGDGENDVFIPVKAINISDEQLVIVNRWGGTVYESSDILAGWDGTHEGELCAEGVYFWKLDYKDHTNKWVELHGFLTLAQ